MSPGEKRNSRLFLIALALLFLSAVLVVAPGQAFARTEARYMMRAGDVVFGNDLYSSRSIQSLFHQQALNVSDLEHYDVDFPVFAGRDGNIVDAGPVAVSAGGLTASANVLPFGPVSLAFPSIHEDVTQTVTATQTGFFNANYNYRPEANYGNVPLSPVYPYTVQQVIWPSSPFGGLGLYPEQSDTWWVKSRLAELNKSAKPAANQTAANMTAANQTSSTGEEEGIPLNELVGNSSVSGQIKAPELKPTLAISYFKPRNASTSPWDMPAVYPRVFDLAGRDGPAFPTPGIGTYSTNGAGSTGASLTGLPASAGAAGILSSNQTAANRTPGSQAAWNSTFRQRIIEMMRPARPSTVSPAGNSLTYVDFNFDATTGQINDMTLLERMWRNSHRGGTMGKAYVGDTSAPYWIDPYPRPNDLSMLDEHWYCLQSALNMVVPGTQIMPRFWSLGIT